MDFQDPFWLNCCFEGGLELKGHSTIEANTCVKQKPTFSQNCVIVLCQWKFWFKSDSQAKRVELPVSSAGEKLLLSWRIHTFIVPTGSFGALGLNAIHQTNCYSISCCNGAISLSLSLSLSLRHNMTHLLIQQYCEKRNIGKQHWLKMWLGECLQLVPSLPQEYRGHGKN